MRWVLLLVLVGCVSKGRHELLEIQLDATRTALNTSQIDQQDELRAADAKSSELEHEIQARQVQLDALALRLAGLEDELANAARVEAEHLLNDQLACDVVPEPPKGPAPKRPPEPAPEPLPSRRPHLDVAVEVLADAVEQGRRTATLAAEREARHQAVRDAFQPLVDDGLAEVDRVGDASVVRILVAKLYNENRTTISPLGEDVLRRAAVGLRALPDHQLRVDGHTDVQLTHSVEHASNWELGFAFAMGVVRLLEEQGIPQVPVAGSMAGTRPIAVDGEGSARLNRRVELVLEPDPSVLDAYAPTPPAPVPVP
jgi:flagellar motor protein MotB